tara:strand:+ start:131 stop:343 length:213 start_codon:yes stop_codon:yes gene_type:complete
MESLLVKLSEEMRNNAKMWNRIIELISEIHIVKLVEMHPDAQEEFRTIVNHIVAEAHQAERSKIEKELKN